jgi:hypothetical protein
LFPPGHIEYKDEGGTPPDPQNRKKDMSKSEPEPERPDRDRTV